MRKKNKEIGEGVSKRDKYDKSETRFSLLFSTYTPGYLKRDFNLRTILCSVRIIKDLNRLLSLDPVGEERESLL